MAKIKKLILLLLLPVLLFGAYALGCIIYAKITYFDPEEKIVIRQNPLAKALSKDSFSILIWNIGYAGLGAETDFFYDGGQMMHPPKEWAEKYLNGIDQTLREHQTDFMMLQEVDKQSKRSYHIDQTKYLLQNEKKYCRDFAINYQVNYIPLPWTTPMGGVLGGLLTLSSFDPINVTRYQLPGAFGFPKQLFFLRRCLLVNQYPLHNGKKLILVNVHNSAYDDSGQLKKAENDYLKKYLQEAYAEGNYIVVGGDWNQCPPDFKYNTFGKGKEGDYYQTNVEKDFIPGWEWIYDASFATNRKNNKAYDQKTTFTTLIDFYLVSPNVKVTRVKGISTDFAFSDHQPVQLDFHLK